MKRLLLATALGVAGLLASTTAAQAQRTDTTYVKPQLPTGPPMAPPTAPAQPTRPVQPQPQQPVRQQQPAQPAPRPSGGIDDDGRTAQPLPGSRPAQPTPSSVPQRPGGGIDDDGRTAQPLPQNGAPVPGATLQRDYQPGKLFLYITPVRIGLSNNEVRDGVSFSAGIAPALGYRITPKLSVGAGPVFVYRNIDFGPDAASYGLPSGYKLHDFGFRGMAQFTFFKEFYLHAEYESTRSQDYYAYQPTLGAPAVTGKITLNTSAIVGGAGYRQRLGDKFALDASLLYNFNSPSNYYPTLLKRLSLVYDLGGK